MRLGEGTAQIKGEISEKERAKEKKEGRERETNWESKGKPLAQG
jgi:hypothetical protein